MQLPMQVATYLYRVTLMPTASAVAGFSPTARRCSPILVRNSTQPETRAIMMARKNSTPMYWMLSVRSAKGQRKRLLVLVRYFTGSSLLTITRARPTPKVVRARPVTFWLARRVMVRVE